MGKRAFVQFRKVFFRGRIEFEPTVSLIFSGDVPNAAPLELDPEPVIPRLTRNEKNLRLSIYDL